MTWRLVAPWTGTVADTFFPVSHLVPSLVWSSFAAPSVPVCPVSQSQGKTQQWIRLGGGPLLHKASLLSPSEAASHWSLSLQEQADTCWWDQVPLISCSGASRSSRIFVRTVKQAASQHSLCIEQSVLKVLEIPLHAWRMAFGAERVTDCPDFNLWECPIPNVQLAGWWNGFIALGGLQMGAGEGGQPSGGAEQGWAQHGIHKLKILCPSIWCWVCFQNRYLLPLQHPYVSSSLIDPTSRALI